MPLPEAPTTATNGWRSAIVVSVSLNWLRPKKNGSSSSRNGRSPRYEQMAARTALLAC
ncbi:MAG: hypothetical protein HWD60_09115 [Defluviicoccus sp.]|nr:MAG: hypothetical protein HWD60_09115 [Defluviicoccus sp.]